MLIGAAALVVGGLGVVGAAAIEPAPAAATSSRVPSAGPASASVNPLAGRTWGVYQGDGDQSWRPYEASTGEERALLAKISERPKAKWFGAWIPDGAIAGAVQDYIANATGGDTEVLVQMAIFRMVPWEGNDRICDRLPTAAEQASYRAWIDAFAGAVGTTHAAIIMQPDGPFALCALNGSKLPAKQIRYATKKLAALPNTHVYIDAGASDWNREDPQRALQMLIPAGVKYARGFAFNSTHYAATADEVAYAAKVAAALRKRGLGDKHAVINTSSNGKGFDGFAYKGRNFDNAKVCRTTTSKNCVTLGIPPTADVANPAWGLSAKLNAKAAAVVDGYLWFGRPWLYNQADPFDLQRALQLARTTPYPGPDVT